MTTRTVHYGYPDALQQLRARTLDKAFLRHPKGFKGVVPRVSVLPAAAWIHTVKTEHASTTMLDNCTPVSRHSVPQSYRHVPQKEVVEKPCDVPNGTLLGD